MSEIEDAVCKKIQDRAALGLNKYGVTIPDAKLSFKEWLVHAQEEAMDLANYLEMLIRQIEGKEEELCKLKEPKTQEPYIAKNSYNYE